VTLDCVTVPKIKYTLLGHDLDMGKCEKVYKNIFATKDVSELKRMIMEDSELDDIEIQLSYESKTLKFYRWLPLE
jgi:hypothetical protein